MDLVDSVLNRIEKKNKSQDELLALTQEQYEDIIAQIKNKQEA